MMVVVIIHCHHHHHHHHRIYIWWWWWWWCFQHFISFFRFQPPNIKLSFPPFVEKEYDGKKIEKERRKNFHLGDSSMSPKSKQILFWIFLFRSLYSFSIFLQSLYIPRPVSKFFFFSSSIIIIVIGSVSK